jgi:LysM repeat protein
MRILFIFMLLLFFGNGFAQQYAVVNVLNGKKYYQHTVSQGNSLFGLQQMYGCPVEEILNVNPGIERGLNDGQLIQIPVIEKTIMHTVEKKETLFSIARMYYVSVDSLMSKNPGSEAGIKIGQRLKVVNATPRVQVDLSSVAADEPTRDVPAPSDSVREKFIVSFHDSIVSHVVLSSETMYSISKRFMVPIEDLMKFNNLKSTKLSPGQVLRIKLKKENVSEVAVRDVPDRFNSSKDSLPVYEKKESYKIALFLPFNLDSTTTLNKAITSAAWDYYMGAKLALDSLTKIGLKADFYIYDYQSKNETIDQQLAKSEIKKMDLIFAPFQFKEAEKVAAWSRINKVRTVFPVSVPSEFLKENKFAYALTPTNELLAANLARYIYQVHENQQIVVIKGSKPEDQLNYESFLSAFRQLPIKTSRPRVIESTWSDYKKYEQMGSDVYYVFLSSEKEKVISLLTTCSTKPNVHVFGLKEWLEFKEVTSELKNKFTFSFASPSYFSYKESTLMPFHKQFRRKYGADLTKMACLGFDATLNICSEFLIGKKMPKGLISNYEFIQSGFGNGFQNNSSFVLEFKDFESKKEK